LSDSASQSNALTRALALVSGDLEQVEAEIGRHMDSRVALIRDVAKYLLEGGGKRLRPALHLLCFRLCGGQGGRAVPVGAALEFLHNATLLHDDVVDEADLRRGKPSANRHFGNQQSVLTGDFLVTRVFTILVEDGEPALLKLISDTTARMAEGEALELSLPSPDAATEAHYLEVVTEKTAILFGACCAAGAILAGRADAERPLWDYGVGFGIAFQLVDDLLDYVGSQERLGKPVGSDLAEGKLTLPLLLALEQADPAETRAILDPVASRAVTEEQVRAATELVRRTGSDRSTLQRAQGYIEQAVARLDSLPEGPERTALQDLARFCVERDF